MTENPDKRPPVVHTRVPLTAEIYDQIRRYCRANDLKLGSYLRTHLEASVGTDEDFIEFTEGKR